MSNTLSRLKKWYSGQCNGLWEHGDGIVIETLDNPGWAIKIDLRGTRWENAMWTEMKFDRGSNDWAFCSKNDAQFAGRGDPDKLDLILDYFLDQLEKT